MYFLTFKYVYIAEIATTAINTNNTVSSLPVSGISSSGTSFSITISGSFVTVFAWFNVPILFTAFVVAFDPEPESVIVTISDAYAELFKPINIATTANNYLLFS